MFTLICAALIAYGMKKGYEISGTGLILTIIADLVLASIIF